LREFFLPLLTDGWKAKIKRCRGMMYDVREKREKVKASAGVAKAKIEEGNGYRYVKVQLLDQPQVQRTLQLRVGASPSDLHMQMCKIVNTRMATSWSLGDWRIDLRPSINNKG
jgi:hypothetical protein